MLYRIGENVIADLLEAKGQITAQVFYIQEIEPIGKRYTSKMQALTELLEEYGEFEIDNSAENTL